LVAGIRLRLNRSTLSYRAFSIRGGRGSGNQYSVVDCLSFGGFGSFGLAPVPAIEPLDAAGGVYELLLAGKERVAVRAYLETYL
jgi:hypothetical protein